MRGLHLQRENRRENIPLPALTLVPRRVRTSPQINGGSGHHHLLDTRDLTLDPMSPAAPGPEEDPGRTRGPEAAPGLGLGLDLVLDPTPDQGRDLSPDTGPGLCPHPGTGAIRALQEKGNLIKADPPILRGDQKTRERLAQDYLLSRDQSQPPLSHSATAPHHLAGSLDKNHGNPPMSILKKSKQKYLKILTLFHPTGRR